MATNFDINNTKFFFNGFNPVELCDAVDALPRYKVELSPIAHKDFPVFVKNWGISNKWGWFQGYCKRSEAVAIETASDLNVIDGHYTVYVPKTGNLFKTATAEEIKDYLGEFESVPAKVLFKENGKQEDCFLFFINKEEGGDRFICRLCLRNDDNKEDGYFTSDEVDILIPASFCGNENISLSKKYVNEIFSEKLPEAIQVMKDEWPHLSNVIDEAIDIAFFGKEVDEEDWYVSKRTYNDGEIHNHYTFYPEGVDIVVKGRSDFFLDVEITDKDKNYMSLSVYLGVSEDYSQTDYITGETTWVELARGYDIKVYKEGATDDLGHSIYKYEQEVCVANYAI